MTIVILLPPGIVADQSSDELIARFKAEARSAWQRIERYDDSIGAVQVRKEKWTLRDGERTQKLVGKGVLRRKPGLFVFETAHASDVIDTAFGRNSEYAFTVEKKPANGQWLLSELYKRGQHGYTAAHADLAPYANPNSYSHLGLMERLSTALDDKRFIIEKAEPVGNGVVKLYFRTALSIAGQEILLNGWMDLDPGNYWSLVASEFESSTGAINRITLVYSPVQEPGQFRPCKSWESIILTKDGKVEAREQVSFEPLGDSMRVTDDMFRLTHYGLPEPDGVKWEKSTPPLVWLALTGVVCAVVGFGFRVAARRFRRVVGSGQHAAPQAADVPHQQ